MRLGGRSPLSSLKTLDGEPGQPVESLNWRAHEKLVRGCADISVFRGNYLGCIARESGHAFGNHRWGTTGPDDNILARD